MHKILINMNTQKVVNYDTEIKPFQFAVKIPELNKIQKTVNQSTRIQKMNYLGDKLYSIIVNGKLVEATERELNGKIGTPIYENVTKPKTVTFFNSPTLFTLSDILESKQSQLIANSNYRNCKLFEVNLQDNIELDYSDHKADTGYKLIRLHPNGIVKIKTQTFDNEINEVKLMLESSNDLKVKYSINGLYEDLDDSLIIKSDNNFKSLDIIIENTSNKEIDVSAFSMLF